MIDECEWGLLRVGRVCGVMADGEENKPNTATGSRLFLSVVGFIP
jgi:hypothetical protein